MGFLSEDDSVGKLRMEDSQKSLGGMVVFRYRSLHTGGGGAGATAIISVSPRGPGHSHERTTLGGEIITASHQTIPQFSSKDEVWQRAEGGGHCEMRGRAVDRSGGAVSPDAVAVVMKGCPPGATRGQIKGAPPV
ncbi:unnamed protein product [Gadus morhua 'NCC']